MVVGVPFFSFIAGTMNLTVAPLSAIILAGGKSWHMGRRNSYATQCVASAMQLILTKRAIVIIHKTFSLE